MQRILTNLDLAGNQIINIRIENVSELPAAEPGRLIYLSGIQRVYYSDGEGWHIFGADILPADKTNLGGIIVGENLSITEDGVLSTSSASQYFNATQFPEVGNAGKLYISLSDESIYIWDATNQRYLIVNGSIDFVPPEVNVTTLPSGQPATVDVLMSGTRSNKKLTFNFGIPKGDTPNIEFTLEENGDLYVEY